MKIILKLNVLHLDKVLRQKQTKLAVPQFLKFGLYTGMKKTTICNTELFIPIEIYYSVPVGGRIWN